MRVEFSDVERYKRELALGVAGAADTMDRLIGLANGLNFGAATAHNFTMQCPPVLSTSIMSIRFFNIGATTARLNAPGALVNALG